MTTNSLPGTLHLITTAQGCKDGMHYYKTLGPCIGIYVVEWYCIGNNISIYQMHLIALPHCESLFLSQAKWETVLKSPSILSNFVSRQLVVPILPVRAAVFVAMVTYWMRTIFEVSMDYFFLHLPANQKWAFSKVYGRLNEAGLWNTDCSLSCANKSQGQRTAETSKTL